VADIKDFQYETNPPSSVDPKDLGRYTYDEFQRVRDALDVTSRWDDLRFPATGINLDSAATRYSFDTTDLAVSFANNSRYTTEQLNYIIQLPHSWKEESALRPHIHWIQNQAAVPNWLIEYRVYNNGDLLPAFGTFGTLQSHAFTWSSGSLVQISSFPEISMTGLRASCFVDVKMWRDTTNVSTEFVGADPVATSVLLKEFDTHYEIDSFGSALEFVKR